MKSGALKVGLMVTAIAAIGASNPGDFHIRENGLNLELSTPWGMKNVEGGYGKEGESTYKIAIPIAQIKPSETPTPSPGAGNNVVIVVPTPGPGSGDGSTREKITEKQTIIEKEASRQISSEGPGGSQFQGPPKIMFEYDDSDRLVLEANRLYNRGKLYQASLVIEELIRKNPKYSRGWIMKGSVMYMMKQKDLAIKAWEQVLTFEPQNSEVIGLLKQYK